MSTIKKLVFPFITAFIFATLLAALFLGSNPLPAGQPIPISLGLLAFSLALTEVFISLRAKKMERNIGLPLAYSVHGIMAIVLMIAAFMHMNGEINAQKRFAALPFAGLAGFLAIALLALATLTGVFVLSNMFTSKSKFLTRIKNSILKREIALWVHRLSVLAIVVIFIHMLAVGFIRSNLLLCLLAGLYVVLAVAGYVASKINNKMLPRYVLINCTQQNTTVYQLEFEPQKTAIMPYYAGQYVFVRFIKSDVPKESHPFSIVSSPAPGNSTLKIMIKNSGDYTSIINKVKKGDIATLEGPYGNFIDEKTANANMPMVMLAGGIGITPILSILKNQAKVGTTRKIILVWGLTSKADLLNTEELEKIKEQNLNFSYSITFSKDTVPNFAKGQITQELLHQAGVSALYAEADFFICGPTAMISSMNSILKNNRVKKEKIHIEKFSF